MTTTQPDRADASTVRDWIERPDPVTVLDVRSPAEFETARIPGSVNVPLNLITNHAGDLAARLDRQVVLVCQSGTRATQAQQRLAGAGADHLHILDGGITAYTTAGGDVIRGRARWPLERQVRLVAGILVLAGLALGAAPPEGPAAQRWGRYRAGRVCAPPTPARWAGSWRRCRTTVVPVTAPRPRTSPSSRPPGFRAAAAAVSFRNTVVADPA